MFDKMIISRSSFWFKLAVFGGFRESTFHWDNSGEYVQDTKSSCEVISSILMALAKAVIILLFSIGVLLFSILGLISLGMPNEATEFIRTMSPFIRVLLLFGASIYIGGGLLGIAFIVVIYLIPGIIRGFKAMMRLLPETDVRDHIRDYLDGVCKPVKIVD
jgi:hypothetical protein